jgi:hypothetical protein
MALEISPSRELDDMVTGEEYAYELDITKELGTKTVDAHIYKIYDGSGDEVTDTVGGGSLVSSGIITFGIKAVSIGQYTLKFIVTCNEVLPDGTPYEFFIRLTLIVA